MQGCPLISLPGRWHQSRDLCVPGRWQRFLPAHEVPFGLAHPPSNQGMHLPLTCGREVAFPRPAPPSKLGFLPAPDFSSGRKECDAALFCATGCWHLLFCLLQSGACLLRTVGPRYLREDKTLAWNLGSDFDQLGDRGQLT